MTWLVTGGAGYIGAHVVEELIAAGMDPVVFDNLSSGVADFVPEGVALELGSITDVRRLAEVFSRYRFDGVIHVAGFKYAGVSVQQPLHTYDVNVTGTANVLRAMQNAGVDNLVFSSSAAVFGDVDVELVEEDTPKRPTSPYGESKLIGEWLIRDQARATGLRHTSLRYFNVVGSGDSGIYDRSPHNLFPLVLEAILAGKTPKIFGDDYSTPDGTCVRDYIHVSDLAKAHVVAAQRLLAGDELLPAYNLGSGDGLSVAQIVRVLLEAAGSDVEPEIGPRRPGDPAKIVASGEAAARDLGWAMRHTVEDMARSAWRARVAADEA